MNLWRAIRPAFLCVALLGAALLCEPALAQEATGMRLESAGFTMRRADTAQKMERLRALPARQFVRRRKAGTPYYIYADPDYCRCAYVGGQQAMNSYRDMVTAGREPPGYREFAQSPSASGPGAGTGTGSGSFIEEQMIQDMDDDGLSDSEQDIFNPGF